MILSRFVALSVSLIQKASLFQTLFDCGKESRRVAGDGPAAMALLKRPGADEMLAALYAANFEIVVWSATFLAAFSEHYPLQPKRAPAGSAAVPYGSLCNEAVCEYFPHRT